MGKALLCGMVILRCAFDFSRLCYPMPKENLQNLRVTVIQTSIQTP